MQHQYEPILNPSAPNNEETRITRSYEYFNAKVCLACIILSLVFVHYYMDTLPRPSNEFDTFLKFQSQSSNLTTTFSEFEEHHDALIPILNKLKPNSNRLFVHFDSHPDLGTCENEGHTLQNLASGKINIEKLHNLAKIQSWILPLIMGNYLKEVIWISGYWCNQFQPGVYEMELGFDENGEMKVRSKVSGRHEYYWKAGQLFRGHLKMIKTWKLVVFSMNKNGNFDSIPIITNKTWVLDVDQDFFCTDNPFRKEFVNKYGEDKLKTLIDLHSRSMKYIWKVDGNVEKMDVFTFVWKLSMQARFELLPRMLWLMLRGVELDDIFNHHYMLPSHCDEEEIDLFMNRMGEILKGFGKTPELITTSKSKGTGYTPHDQQSKISRALKQTLKQIWYLEDFMVT